MLLQDPAELIYLLLTDGTVRQPVCKTARELKHGGNQAEPEQRELPVSSCLFTPVLMQHSPR